MAATPGGAGVWLAAGAGGVRLFREPEWDVDGVVVERGVCGECDGVYGVGLRGGNGHADRGGGAAGAAWVCAAGGGGFDSEYLSVDCRAAGDLRVHDWQLGVVSSVGAVAASTVLAMDVSPDGQWLAALEVATQTLDIFQINTSSGALTPASTLPYNVASGLFSPRSVRFSPNGAYLFAALGAAGDVGFSFDTGTGVATATTPLSTGATTVSDNAVLVNAASTVLYIARSGTVNGVMAFTIGSGGALTPVAGSPFLAGMTPYALQLDATGSYLYVANRGRGRFRASAVRAPAC